MAKRRPSGDGMVRKRPDGRWEGRIVVGHKENGESIFRYVSAGSQKELTEKLRRSIEDYRAVELTEDSRMTLSEWLDRWLDEYAAPTVRPSTLAGYRQYIDGYIKPRLGEKQISKVTAEDVRRLYRELQKEGRLVEHPDYGRRLSGSTIRNIHGVLHEAMQNGKINPVAGIFLMKNNMDYQDKSEVVLTPNSPLGDQKTPEELQQQYIEAAGIEAPDED